jgi:transcriptional regulator with XRE-family HTH domain
MEFDRKGFYREVGYRLQHERKRRSFTQTDVAAAIGISRATYANVESGRQTVALDVAWRIHVILGVPIDKLCPEPITQPPSGESTPPSTNSATALDLASLDLVDQGAA